MGCRGKSPMSVTDFTDFKEQQRQSGWETPSADCFDRWKPSREAGLQ